MNQEPFTIRTSALLDRHLASENRSKDCCHSQSDQCDSYYGKQHRLCYSTLTQRVYQCATVRTCIFNEVSTLLIFYQAPSKGYRRRYQQRV